MRAPPLEQDQFRSVSQSQHGPGQPESLRSTGNPAAYLATMAGDGSTLGGLPGANIDRDAAAVPQACNERLARPTPDQILHQRYVETSRHKGCKLSRGDVIAVGLPRPGDG